MDGIFPKSFRTRRPHWICPAIYSLISAGSIRVAARRRPSGLRLRPRGLLPRGPSNGRPPDGGGCSTLDPARVGGSRTLRRRDAPPLSDLDAGPDLLQLLLHVLRL